jgi:hypothetical protein
MTFADRVIRLNLWYDALPELQRFLVFPTVLVIAGAINMVWTISYGYPFGLLFLMALLALIAIRAPYKAGRYRFQAHAAARLPALEHQPKLDHPGFTPIADYRHELEAVPVPPAAAAPAAVEAAMPALADRPVRTNDTPAVTPPVEREEAPVPQPAQAAASAGQAVPEVLAREPAIQLPAEPVKAPAAPPAPVISAAAAPEPIAPEPAALAAAPAMQQTAPAVQQMETPVSPPVQDDQAARARRAEKPSGKRGATQAARRKPGGKKPG